MPIVRSGDADIAYDVTGEGDPLLLVMGLGADSKGWTAQTPVFAERHRVITFDNRGAGRSSTPPGSYTTEQMGRDALAVLDAAGIERADVCGVSLGGLTALWLGIHAPDRVGCLVAANTAARLGSREGWSDRIEQVRAGGMEAVAEGGLARWFTSGFRDTHPETADRFRAMLLACPVEGYTGACAVLRDADLRADLGRIAAPTLVVSGTHDTATPPALGAEIAAGVREARTIELDAAHLSNVEQPIAFTAAVLDFLA